MKTILFLTLGIFTLIACVEEPEDKSTNHPDNILEQKAYEQDVSGFVLPDSIDVSRVVATYYDAHVLGYGIIVYADTSKKTAANLTFLPDKTVQRDIMTQKAFNEFTSVFGGTEYIVTEKHVTIIIERNSTSMTHAFERVDN